MARKVAVNKIPDPRTGSRWLPLILLFVLGVLWGANPSFSKSLALEGLSPDRRCFLANFMGRHGLGCGLHLAPHTGAARPGVARLLWVCRVLHIGHFLYHPDLCGWQDFRQLCRCDRHPVASY